MTELIKPLGHPPSLAEFHGQKGAATQLEGGHEAIMESTDQ